MKIVFLQNKIFGNTAIMLLSAILKRAGHQCIVLIDALEENIIEKALKINPTIIAFSITSSDSTWMIARGRDLRKIFKKFIICGGPHPTFYPEIIQEGFLDAICIGEGEEAIIDLVNAIENNEDITGIKNLIVKKDNNIYYNEIRPLIQNLDSNPFPHRTIYDHYAFFKDPKNDIFCKNTIQTSRGCPFKCTFCLSSLYNKICEGKGKTFRNRTVPNVVEELMLIKKEYPQLKLFNFVDDSFTLSPRTWLYAFLEQYKREINIPFAIQTRPDLLDEYLIKKLKEANCYAIKMGIESGNNYIRNTIFKKGITTQQILKITSLIKKYGIKLHINNILGAPGETLETALETFEFSRKINPTFAMGYPLNPFPGTEIFYYAIKRKYLDQEYKNKGPSLPSYFDTPIKLKNKKEIINLHKIFAISIFLHLPTSLVKFFIKLPFTRLYNFILGVSLWIEMLIIHRLSFFNSLKISFLHFSKDFF